MLLLSLNTVNNGKPPHPRCLSTLRSTTLPINRRGRRKNAFMGILTASSHYFRVGAHMAASQTLPSLKKTRQGQISIRFCSSEFHLKYANEMKIWFYQRNQVLPPTKLIARMKLVQAQKIRERGNKVKSEVNASIYTNLV